MWFILSVSCAFFLSLSDLLSKIALRDNDIYLVSWARVSIAFILLLPSLLFIPIPPINPLFWRVCLLLFPFEILALFLYIKALQVSPLSLTTPFLSLTPLVLILTSYLMLGETLDMSGVIGIVLIAIGFYILNIRQVTTGMMSPIKAIFSERGSWLMIIVAVIYSITANLGKMAIRSTSPIFFVVFLNGISALITLPFPLLFSRRPIQRIMTQSRVLIGIGIAYALMSLFHMLAVIRVEVAYMIAIKRMSPVFSVISGYLFLHEEDFRARITGTIVMVAGVVLILL